MTEHESSPCASAPFALAADEALVSDRIPSPIAALIRAPAVAATDMSCIPLTWLTMRCIGTDWNLARCFWEFSSSKQLSAMTRKRPKTRGHVLRVKTRRSHLRRDAVIACWRRSDSRRLRAYSAARQFGPPRSRWALPGGALASDASHEGTAARAGARRSLWLSRRAACASPG
jgi:hypothetical protein